MNWRIRISGARLLHFITGWPSRLWRLVLWLLWIKSPRGKHAVLRWASGLFLLGTDLLPLSLLYETLMVFVKRKMRRLNPLEQLHAEAVFGNSFPFHLVAMNPDSQPVRRRNATAYVLFNTINFYNTISKSTLIHELVHVWQYHRHGSAYISEALWAQHWGGGYNYGGIGPLKMYSEVRRLSGFNFEQQADIIEDYYRWKNGMPMHWVSNLSGVGHMLEKYRNEMLK